MAEMLCIYRESAIFRDTERPASHVAIVPYNEEPAIQARGFLKQLDAAYAADTAIKVIPDNCSVRIIKDAKAWLATQPEGRFTFVFTPKHGFGLNLVEGFGSKMARSMLRHIRAAQSRTQRQNNQVSGRPQSTAGRQPLDLHNWRSSVKSVTLWKRATSERLADDFLIGAGAECLRPHASVRLPGIDCVGMHL